MEVVDEENPKQARKVLVLGGLFGSDVFWLEAMERDEEDDG